MGRKGWRESSTDPQAYQFANEDNPTWRGAPATVVSALMEAAPHEEVRRSREELAAVGDLIAEAIDGLPPLERDVFNALNIERATYREVADRNNVGVATVDRIKERAVHLLRTALDGKVDEWVK